MVGKLRYTCLVRLVMTFLGVVVHGIMGCTIAPIPYIKIKQAEFSFMTVSKNIIIENRTECAYGRCPSLYRIPPILRRVRYSYGHTCYRLGSDRILGWSGSLRFFEVPRSLAIISNGRIKPIEKCALNGNYIFSRGLSRICKNEGPQNQLQFGVIPKQGRHDFWDTQIHIRPDLSLRDFSGDSSGLGGVIGRFCLRLCDSELAFNLSSRFDRISGSLLGLRVEEASLFRHLRELLMKDHDSGNSDREQQRSQNNHVPVGALKPLYGLLWIGIGVAMDIVAMWLIRIRSRLSRSGREWCASISLAFLVIGASIFPIAHGTNLILGI